MLLSPEEQKQIFKEIFPYAYYTKQKYIGRVGNIRDAHKYTKDTLENFTQSIKNAGALLSSPIKNQSNINQTSVKCQSNLDEN